MLPLLSGAFSWQAAALEIVCTCLSFRCSYIQTSFLRCGHSHQAHGFVIALLRMRTYICTGYGDVGRVARLEWG